MDAPVRQDVPQKPIVCTQCVLTCRLHTLHNLINTTRVYRLHSLLLFLGVTPQYSSTFLVVPTYVKQSVLSILTLHVAVPNLENATGGTVACRECYSYLIYRITRSNAFFRTLLYHTEPDARSTTTHDHHQITPRPMDACYENRKRKGEEKKTHTMMLNQGGVYLSIITE